MKYVVLLVVAAACIAEEVEPGCRYKGNVYKNGDTWDEKGAFRMKCIVEENGSWRTEVSGCMTPSGIEVPVNTTKSDGQMDWICESGAEGTITLKQKRGKTADCDGGHKSGDKWVDKSFEFECAEGGVPKFVGCVAPNGDKIGDGTIKEVDGFKMECKQHANGTVALQGLPKDKDAECVGKDGEKHAHGSTWVENVMFEYKCDDFGAKTIKGCVVKEQGLTIPINETRTAGNTVFHCEMKDGSYRFYTSQKE